jgi:omega-amidase
MTTKLTISLAQMDCRLGDPETNFAHAATLIAEAARRGSDLVLLPELWSTAYALDAAPVLASPLANSAQDGGWFGRVAALAAEHRLYVGGSLLEARGGRYYNCFALYGPDGVLCRAAYRKIHLFRLMDEEKWLAAGRGAG